MPRNLNKIVRSWIRLLVQLHDVYRWVQSNYPARTFAFLYPAPPPPNKHTSSPASKKGSQASKKAKNKTGKKLVFPPIVDNVSVFVEASSQIYGPWLGDTVDSSRGLSCRPARLHQRLAGRYDDPMPESTISPIQGLWIWLQLLCALGGGLLQGCLQRTYANDVFQVGFHSQPNMFTVWSTLKLVISTVNVFASAKCVIRKKINTIYVY
jgi:hypothetical protein